MRNKSWLVAQGCTQVKGVYFDESFPPIARLESIRILLSIACIVNFKLYQMDVKSAFLNGLLQEEVLATKMISRFSFSGSRSLVEKGFVWVEASSKGLV